MPDMTLKELKTIIDSTAEHYPNARVDFVYPKTRAGKKVGALSHMSSYKMLLDAEGGVGIFRIALGYAREEDD